MCNRRRGVGNRLNIVAIRLRFCGSGGSGGFFCGPRPYRCRTCLLAEAAHTGWLSAMADLVSFVADSNSAKDARRLRATAHSHYDYNAEMSKMRKLPGA
jgi:hypothetical protein